MSKYYVVGHVSIRDKDKTDLNAFKDLMWFMQRGNYAAALSAAAKIFGTYDTYSLEEHFEDDAKYSITDLKTFDGSSTKDWPSYQQGPLILLWSPSQEELFYIQRV